MSGQPGLGWDYGDSVPSSEIEVTDVGPLLHRPVGLDRDARIHPWVDAVGHAEMGGRAHDVRT